MMFDLAWHGKGMVVNLENLPDWALKMFVDMANEAIEEENDRAPNLPPGYR